MTINGANPVENSADTNTSTSNSRRERAEQYLRQHDLMHLMEEALYSCASRLHPQPLGQMRSFLEGHLSPDVLKEMDEARHEQQRILDQQAHELRKLQEKNMELVEALSVLDSSQGKTDLKNQIASLEQSEQSRIEEVEEEHEKHKEQMQVQDADLKKQLDRIKSEIGSQTTKYQNAVESEESTASSKNIATMQKNVDRLKLMESELSDKTQEMRDLSQQVKQKMARIDALQNDLEGLA